MRVVISGLPDGNSVVLDRLTAVIVAGEDDKSEAAPIIAHGERQQLAQIGALVLVSIRQKLGSDVFERVVRHARSAKYVAEDHSPSIPATGAGNG